MQSTDLNSNLLFFDEAISEKLTFSEIVDYVSNPLLFSRVYNEKSTKGFILNFIAGLINHRPVYLVDLNSSENEIKRLIGEIKPEFVEEIHVKRNFSSFKDLLDAIRSSQSDLIMFTSGTTGEPKKIIHKIDSFLRSVKTGSENTNKVWGLCFSITHMAGLQVFFQAFFNQCPLIHLYQYKKSEIEKLIGSFSITNLSGTPTFYRMLMPLSGSFNSVSQITLGGEKSSSTLVDQLKLFFPKARITNIYASTESGSILKSSGEFFEIKKEFSSKITIIDNELCVHKDLVGKGISIDENGWYHTGDIVEIIEQNPIKLKFLHRKTDAINVGGIKVDPTEIEEELLKHPNIKLARVYGRKNSILGNIVMAEIVCIEDKQLSELEIKDFLSETLQEFKIPRIIKIVDNIEITQSGKTKKI